MFNKNSKIVVRMFSFTFLIIALFTNIWAVDPTDVYSEYAVTNSYADNSPNGRDATNSGTSFVTSPLLSTNVDYSTLWDIGGTDEILFPYDTGVLGTQFSFEVWMYPITTPLNGWGLISNDLQLNRGTSLVWDTGAGGRFVWASVNPALVTRSAIASYSLTNLNEWTHVIGTYDDGIMKVYINGALAVTGGSAGGGLPRDGNNNFQSGYSFIDEQARHFRGNMNIIRIWNNIALNSSDVNTLYNSGEGCTYEMLPTCGNASPTLIVDINSPTDEYTFPYVEEEAILNVTSSLVSTCSFIESNISTPMNTGNNLTHTYTFNMGTANPSTTKEFNVYFSCYNIENNLTTNTTEITFYQNPLPPIDIQLITPIDAQEFTFDVENVLINVTTDVISSCELRVYFDNNYSMTTTNNLTHTYNYNMGVAINSTKEFQAYVNCISEDNVNTNLSDFSFYQLQEPLTLEIFVPMDEQEFDSNTNSIIFHVETNYQAVCDYLVYNMSSYEEFMNTNSNVHTTNYTTFYPNVFTYNTSFSCNGTIINESVVYNLTFYLSEDIINGETSVITDFTGQLDEVGGGVGGFMKNLAGGVMSFIMIFAIVGFFVVTITFIFKNIGNIGGRK